MKIVAVVPARYKSSRFPGKPLADLHGKPMVWWVYNSIANSKKVDATYVATDDERIAQACKDLGMNCVMTSPDHVTVTDRVYEFATKVDADLYLHINGDEPLLRQETVEKIIPASYDPSETYIANLTCKIPSPVEAIDSTNIKIAIGADGRALYMSRSPIPYPKGSLDFDYWKHVGVIICNRKALDFYKNTPRGYHESVEDNDWLRFIENNINFRMVKIEETDFLSVDNPKDLVKVREMLTERGVKAA
jgi:3-deoxy-manno-octulosonate cytidylyltransferase (CMP-KDO synthetase)